MNCRGDEDIDAKRSRPSIGKPVVGHREERTRAPVWDRSADHIRASGQCGCIAMEAILQAKTGRIHGCTRTLRRKGQIPLALRAPSIHGPQRRFAAMQRDACCSIEADVRLPRRIPPRLTQKQHRAEFAASFRRDSHLVWRCRFSIAVAALAFPSYSCRCRRTRPIARVGGFYDFER
jgi:hypothetical protein